MHEKKEKERQVCTGGWVYRLRESRNGFRFAFRFAFVQEFEMQPMG